MSWLIQSEMEGPVLVADIGLTFTARQIKDIDLIGRCNAERSNDIKYLLLKKFLKEIRKDPSDEGIDPKLVQQFAETVKKAEANVKLAEAHNEKLQTQNEALKKQNEEIHAKMDSVLNEVKAFAEKFPLELKTIGEAMRNIKIEQADVASRREFLPQSGESEAEIATQDKILSMKEKKLEKNLGDLGKTISESAKDVNEALDAMDQLGIV